MTLRDQFLPLIAAPGGASVAEIVAATGRSTGVTKKALNLMRRDGLIASTYAAKLSRWYLADKIPVKVPAAGGMDMEVWRQRKARILEMASAPKGVLSRDIAAEVGLEIRQTEALLQRMRKAGLVQPLKAAQNSRWFLYGKVPEVVRKAKNIRYMPERAKPLRGEVIIPEGLKVQHGPSWTHDGRFQLHPDAAREFRGEFSRLGPGRYL